MLSRSVDLAVLVLVLASPAAAQVTTDAGTIDPATTAQYFKAPGYSPYVGPPPAGRCSK